MYDTALSPEEETQFQAWKRKYAPHDSGEDYDLRGAFKAGLQPAENGHWADTYKKPNHPTFSDQSQYAAFGNPGSWEGDTYIAPKEKRTMQPTLASPSGNYADPSLSPQVQEWIRKQLMDQMMSQQARGVIPNTPQQLPNNPTPMSSDAGMLPPPNQPALPPPAAAASDAGMLPPPDQMPSGTPVPGMPQSPMAPPSPAAPMSPDGSMPIEQAARGSQMAPGQGQLMDAHTQGWLNAPEDTKAMFSAGPAITPEQIAERRTLWTQFVDGFKNSPHLPAMLMHFGAQMTQPRDPGQNNVGQFTKSVQGSMDYLAAQKQQEAQLAHTQATTGEVVAKTATEQQRPAQVVAETGLAGAQTGATVATTAKTQEEITQMKATRDALVKKLNAEVDELVAKKGLTLEQAREAKTKADTNPAEVASMIELRKAHAYYFTHPEMHARAMESAKNQSIENLAQAMVHGGDDALTELFKTDPDKATAKARLEAQAGQVGQYWKGHQQDREANDIFNQVQADYEAKKKSGAIKKDVNLMDFIRMSTITEGLPGEMMQKIHARVGREETAAKTPAAPGKGNPSGYGSGAAAGWDIKPIK